MSFEKSKSQNYNIQKMDEMLSSNRIRVDHPNQRLCEQWVKEYQDNLIADVLAGNPISLIIICEQILRDLPTAVPMYWLIDGKQRATTLVKFRRNLIKLGNKIDRPFVEYFSVDNSGDEPVVVRNTFDVRGKRYEDLPKELQDSFDLYDLRGELYLDCTDDDIEFHIRRFNRMKPMTAAQKGILYLGVETTRVVKRIAQHGFFRDGIGKYSAKDVRNGAIDRIITDSIMASNFLPCWKKGNNAICAYLKEHVSASAFDRFEDNLNRLECVVTEEINEFFDNKNSFIFFTLFDRFTRYGISDDRFADFLMSFDDGMRRTEINGTSYEALCEKGTKDKNVVSSKLDILETLMCDFLGVDKIDSTETITINDRNLMAMEETIENSVVVKEACIGKEDVKIATLRYLSNEEISDEELQDFAYKAEITREQIDDIGFYLDLLSEYIENSADITCDNLATYLRFIKRANEIEASDKKIINCLNGLNGSESYEEMVASLVGNQTAA